MTPLLIAQRKIASMWFWFGGLIFLIIIAQTIFGKYGDNYLKAIGWFSKNLLPTILVLVGTIAYNSRNEESKEKNISSYFAKIVKSTSWFYFILITLFFLAQPIIYTRMGKSAIETLEMSTPYLALIQGFINALIGAITIDVKTSQTVQP